MIGTPGPEIARVVQLAVDHRDGPVRGSGYLLGPSTVLTAAHAVRDASAVTVISAQARPGWTAEADPQPLLVQSDIALLRLRTPVPVLPLPAGAYGRIGLEGRPVSGRAIGFPRLQRRRDRTVYGTDELFRDSYTIDGRIERTDNVRAGTLHIKLSETVHADGESPWAGISGAALFAGGLLVGVINQDPQSGVDALEAVRIADFIALCTPEERLRLNRLSGMPSAAEALADVTEDQPRRARPELDDVAAALADHLLPRYDEEARLLGLTGPTVLAVAWEATDPARERLSGRLPDVLSTFRAGRGQLVILGRSGMGKTALAYQLARQYLDRWRAGHVDTVPVVLPLASWNPRASGLFTWIEDRLRTMLKKPGLSPALVDRAVGTLLDQGRVLPILDGLDEMAAVLRVDVLEILRERDAPWVLTSRPGAYEAAARSARTLKRADVVTVKPLPADEVRDYLVQEDEATWRPFFERLGVEPHDVAGPLISVLSTPLTASLAATVYGPRNPPEQLLDISSPGAIRNALLDGAIDAAYRPSARRDFRIGDTDVRQARRWLGFLARSLDRTGLPDLRWWMLEYSAPALLVPVIAAIVAGTAWGLSSIPEEGGHQAAVNAWMGAAAGFLFGLVGRLSLRDRRQADPARASGDRETNRLLNQHLSPTMLRVLVVVIFLVLTPVAVGVTYEIVHLGLLWTGSLFPGKAEVVRRASAYMLVVAALIGTGLGLYAAAATYTYIARTTRNDVVDVEPESAMDPRLRFGGRPFRLVVVGMAAFVVVAVVLIRVWLFSLSDDVRWSWPGAVLLGLGNAVVALVAVACLTRPPRYQAARLWLSGWGRLPWALEAFLDDAVSRRILRRTGAVHGFRHAALRRILAGHYEGDEG
jgi:hypothetical protein